MKDNLASCLKAISNDIPENLISLPCLDRLCSIAQHFPDSIVSLFGFESNLTEVESVVDFFFCLEAEGEGREWLKEASFSPLMAKQPTWQKISHFANQWADADSPVSSVEDVWLEFDFEQTQQTTPIPSLFFSVEHFTTDTDYRWWAENVLTPLKSNPLSEEAQNTLINCFTALPENIEPFQLGILLPRKEQLRIYLTFVSYQELLDYLSKINWQGDLSLWEYLLAQFTPLVDNFQLQIEIQENLSPEIAIELYPRNDSCWRRILNYLTKIDFCLLEKKLGLLDYQNINEIIIDSTQQINPQLAYLKMSYQVAKPITFKAYLIADK